MKVKVRISANFERNLTDIESFLADTGASETFDALLDGLEDQVIPNLEAFPAMGPSFLARPGAAVEVRQALNALRKKLAPGVELRQCLWGDYLLLYSWEGGTVFLLSVKHHRQLSFDLNSRWN